MQTFGRLTAEDVFNRTKAYIERHKYLEESRHLGSACEDMFKNAFGSLLCQKDEGHGILRPVLLDDKVILLCQACKNATSDIPAKIVWPWFADLGIYLALAREKQNQSLLQGVAATLKRKPDAVLKQKKVVFDHLESCVANEGPYWLCSWAETDRRYRRNDLWEAIDRLAEDDKQEWARIMGSATQESVFAHEIFGCLKKMSPFSADSTLAIIAYQKSASTHEALEYHASSEIGRPFGVDVATVADRLVAKKSFLRAGGEMYLVSIPKSVFEKVVINGTLLESEAIVKSATQKLLELAEHNNEVFWAGSTSYEGRRRNAPAYEEEKAAR